MFKGEDQSPATSGKAVFACNSLLEFSLVDLQKAAPNAQNPLHMHEHTEDIIKFCYAHCVI